MNVSGLGSVCWGLSLFFALGCSKSGTPSDVKSNSSGAGSSAAPAAGSSGRGEGASSDEGGVASAAGNSGESGRADGRGGLSGATQGGGGVSSAGGSSSASGAFAGDGGEVYEVGGGRASFGGGSTDALGGHSESLGGGVGISSQIQGGGGSSSVAANPVDESGFGGGGGAQSEDTGAAGATDAAANHFSEGFACGDHGGQEYCRTFFDHARCSDDGIYELVERCSAFCGESPSGAGCRDNPLGLFHAEDNYSVIGPMVDCSGQCAYRLPTRQPPGPDQWVSWLSFPPADDNPSWTASYQLTIQSPEADGICDLGYQCEVLDVAARSVVQVSLEAFVVALGDLDEYCAGEPITDTRCVISSHPSAYVVCSWEPDTKFAVYIEYDSSYPEEAPFGGCVRTDSDARYPDSVYD